jgi:hypothetical protein
MKLIEVLNILNKLHYEYGDDIPVEIDHRDFPITMDINEIEVGDTYSGPHKPIIYIYVDDHDANRLGDIYDERASNTVNTR